MLPIIDHFWKPKQVRNVMMSTTVIDPPPSFKMSFEDHRAAIFKAAESYNEMVKAANTDGFSIKTELSGDRMSIYRTVLSQGSVTSS